MKQPLLLIINLTFVCQHLLSINKDSTNRINYSVSFGTYSFIFNNDLYTSQSPTSSFIANQINPFSNYAFGLKCDYLISKKKSALLSLQYSSSSIGYLYSHSSIPNGRSENSGKIVMNAFLLNTAFKHSLTKHLSFNYGFSHYFNMKNKFDNDSIARIVSWNKPDNSSNMKIYTISLLLGVEVKIYKRVSFEVNFMRGLNNFIDLQFLGDNKSRTSEKLRYGGFSINYRF